MALNTLSLIVDVTASQKNGILQSFDDRQPAIVPLFIRNDGVPLTLRFVIPSVTTSRPWDDVDLSAADVSIALGKFDAIPTSGASVWTYGADSTAALSYASTAAQIATALNALASIISAGGVTVTEPESGVFVVQFTNIGARTLISVNVAGLNPQSGSTTSEVVVGDAGHQSVQVVEVLLVPYALNSTWTDFTAEDAVVTPIAAGSVNSPNVQSIQLLPVPYAGTFQITTNLLTTAAIPFGATATAVQAALNTGGNNYLVTGDAGGPWTITTVANGSVAAFTVNTAGLSVPIGLNGNLSLSTFSMLQAFFTEGLDVITLEMEIQVTVSGQEPVTVLQVPVQVSKDVINLQSLSPTPLVLFYTQAQVDAIIAALHNAATGSLSAAGSITPSIATNCKWFTQTITLGAGSGSYTAVFGMVATNRRIGDKAQLNLNLPASSNPTLEVHDGTGATIYTRAANGIAQAVPPLTFTFNGTQFISDQGAS